MDFSEITNKTIKTDSRFKIKFNKKQMLLDLIEQIGELSEALLWVDVAKEQQGGEEKTEEDVANAMTDILYDLILLAELHGVDLEKEYLKTLKEIDRRFKNNEYLEKDE